MLVALVIRSRKLSANQTSGLERDELHFAWFKVATESRLGRAEISPRASNRPELTGWLRKYKPERAGHLLFGSQTDWQLSIGHF